LINFSQEEILVEGMTTTSIVEGTTSLTQVELERLIDIYPNPTSWKLNLFGYILLRGAGNLFPK